MQNLIPYETKSTYKIVDGVTGHWRFRFENGFGASIIPYENGVLEGAVLVFHSDDLEDFNLTYDTPVCHDVLRFFNMDEVRQFLTDISLLQPNTLKGQSNAPKQLL